MNFRQEVLTNQTFTTSELSSTNPLPRNHHYPNNRKPIIMAKPKTGTRKNTHSARICRKKGNQKAGAAKTKAIREPVPAMAKQLTVQKLYDHLL
jgi:hypothetical protein